jgi:hypothetical protein
MCVAITVNEDMYDSEEQHAESTTRAESVSHH